MLCSNEASSGTKTKLSGPKFKRHVPHNSGRKFTELQTDHKADRSSNMVRRTLSNLKLVEIYNEAMNNTELNSETLYSASKQAVTNHFI